MTFFIIQKCIPIEYGNSHLLHFIIICSNDKNNTKSVHTSLIWQETHHKYVFSNKQTGQTSIYNFSIVDQKYYANSRHVSLSFWQLCSPRTTLHTHTLAGEKRVHLLVCVCCMLCLLLFDVHSPTLSLHLSHTHSPTLRWALSCSALAVRKSENRPSK